MTRGWGGNERKRERIYIYIYVLILLKKVSAQPREKSPQCNSRANGRTIGTRARRDGDKCEGENRLSQRFGPSQSKETVTLSNNV